MLTKRKKTEFTYDKSDIVQDLNNLLRFKSGQQKNANTLSEINNALAMSSLAAVIKYLELTNDNLNFGIFELKLLNLNRFVHLDSAAVNALNLYPKPGISLNNEFYRWHSVLGVLDRCRTAQGHRLMMQWLKQPLRDKTTINDRHNMVECFINHVTVRDELHDNYLKRMPDIMMLGKKLIRKKATLQDIFRIYQVIMRIPKILDLLESTDDVTVKNILHDPLKSTYEVI